MPVERVNDNDKNEKVVVEGKRKERREGGGGFINGIQLVVAARTKTSIGPSQLQIHFWGNSSASNRLGKF